MLPSRSWREYPHTYRLEAARCVQCGKAFFPPRLVCSKCRSRKFERFNMKGTGKVMTHTVIRTPSDEFSGQAPFVVGIVEMDEGVRLLSEVVDVAPRDLEIDMEVSIYYEDVTDEVTLPKFKRV